MLVTLGRQGIKTLDDLADLASDELLEMVPDSAMNEEDANALIMAARAHWFDDDDETGETDGAEADGAEAEGAKVDGNGADSAEAGDAVTDGGGEA
jgi:N utilization substance protein A